MSYDTPQNISDADPYASRSEQRGHSSARAELERSLRLQSRLLDVVEQALIATDLDGTIIYWNRCAAELYGWPAEEAVGMNIMDVTVTGSLQSKADVIMQALRMGQSWEGEFEVRRRDGTCFTALVADHPVITDDGELIGVIGLSRESGHRVHPEPELEAGQLEAGRHTESQMASESARRANDAKNRFLAMLSHELRTPLTPVLAAVHVLETDENMPVEFRPFIDIIHRNIELEARLIDDLIDFTRISKGTLELNAEPVALHALIEHVIEIVGADLRAKRIDLLLRLDGRRHVLTGDAGRLQQVLWNLVKNAIKFTPSMGTITIETGNDMDGWITLSVNDTGIGIEHDRLPYIFNAFELGDEVPAGMTGGLGLGLAISRNIVEMHGGRLTAISPGEGMGATFIVELPGVI